MLFWGTFSGGQNRNLSEVKMGELLAAPESHLLPLLPFYLRDFLYMISFYSLTSILEFTSETSERERKQRTCKHSFKHPHLLMLHMMSTSFLLSSTKSHSVHFRHMHHLHMFSKLLFLFHYRIKKAFSTFPSYAT